MNLPRPWRAWHTFQATLVAALLMLTAAMAAAAVLRVSQGELNEDQTRALLGALYWGSYPLVFTSLGALAWHVIRTERGDYV